ncbi:MAG: hypothetical protein LBV75_00630 [Paludibacter sp.]|jgi:hypothetical protein|nr:hypothetical protein [Paludibacter sp.]
MKNINKISILLLTIIATLFISCEDEIARDPSPAANPNSDRVYFPEQDSSKNFRTLLLGIEDTKFEVKIARENYTNPLTVKVKVTSDNATLFSVPASVSFAAGESVTSFDVTVGNIELLKNYSVNIEVDDDIHLDPYYSKYPVTVWSITKEDFIPYADGIYDDPFWNDISAIDIVLEYSQSTKFYRMRNIFDGGGEAFLFGWDGDQIITIKDGSGPSPAVYIAKGYNVGYYWGDSEGWVYAFFVKDQSRTVGGAKLSYDAATKTFTFPIFWGFASGSGWGWYASTYKITNLY